MHIKFNGWGHDAGTRYHFVAPITEDGNRLKAGTIFEPLVWQGPQTASGKISGMKLGGDYLVEFQFSEDELKNWLLQYVKAEPEAAIKLLSEAILALSPKPQEEEFSLDD